MTTTTDIYRRPTVTVEGGASGLKSEIVPFVVVVVVVVVVGGGGKQKRAALSSTAATAHVHARLVIFLPYFIRHN